MRIAIIDLGTNTFNLMIVETSGQSTFKKLIEVKIPVKIGKGGINNSIITPDAFDRGVEALKKHKETIDIYNVSQTFAFATSGIRSADNGQEFVDSVKKEVGITIQVISGDQEAEYIHKGVKQAVELNHEKSLILDIGGGSNELIISNKDNVFWKRSFQLGIARLLEKFNPSDPIQQHEVKIIEDYLHAELKPLEEALLEHPVDILIGSSGSFDTFAEMIAHDLLILEEFEGKTHFEIDLVRYNELHDKLIRSSHHDRTEMKGLEPMRIEMIVLASIFVNFIVNKYEIKKLIRSSYAMKEGVVSDILQLN